MKNITIKVLKNNAIIPLYKTSGAAGCDISSIEDYIIIYPNERIFVSTGLYMEIPEGFEAQIRPRSGLACNRGVTVMNSPATIDSDYRGEIKVCLVNLGNEKQIIKKGDRIAQLVFAPVFKADFHVVYSLDETERGQGGFGSTGV